MKKLKSKTSAGHTIVRALSCRWIPLSELATILGLSQEQAYEQIVSLSKQNCHYTLLVRDGEENEPRILVLPRVEWRHLLRYVAMFPRE